MIASPTQIATLLLLAGATAPALAGKAAEFGADWDDPRTAAPPVERPDSKSCTVQIVDHGFRDFEAYHSTIAPPADCPGPWSTIVLDLDGSVKGRQYDRIARIEVGGVTVFYTSTPEPSREGITWHAEKDLSAYAPLFAHKQDVAMWLGNVVNDTYTGIFQIKAKVTFYQADATHPTAHAADRIALPQDVQRDGPDVTGKFTLPTSTQRLVAEVYATGSGGGCEEFWYFTAPAATKYSCPSEEGPYRELQVLVDGRVAGIAMPYPNIWTGGWSNPFLWYVLPAPRAFDVRPFQFDLTPFIGALNDGKPHDLRVRVLGVGADSKGWQLLPSLQLWLDPSGKPTHGKVLEYRLDELARTHLPSTDANGDTRIEAHGSHRLSVRGELHAANGRTETAIEYAVVNHNSHRWDDGEKRDMLTAEWTTTVNTTVKAPHQATIPTTQWQRYAIDGGITTDKAEGGDRLTTALKLDDASRTQRFRGKRVVASTETQDRFEGSAFYTSGVPREKRNAVGHSKQRYTVRAGDRCYDRTIAQENGFITEDRDGCTDER